jgi:hypothetical protein
VVSFWEGQSHRFPRLAKLARRILAIPASSACCERVFSALKRMVTDERISLGEETVHLLMLVKALYGLE